MMKLVAIDLDGTLLSDDGTISSAKCRGYTSSARTREYDYDLLRTFSP